MGKTENKNDKRITMQILIRNINSNNEELPELITINVIKKNPKQPNPRRL